MYGSAPDESERDVWSELLVAADKYDIQKLKAICEACLARDLKVDNVVDSLLLAEAHQCETLLGRAMDFYKVHVDSSELEEENWRKLRTNPNLLVKLLQRCSK